MVFEQIVDQVRCFLTRRLKNSFYAAMIMLIAACNLETPPTPAPIDTPAEFESALVAAGEQVEHVEGRAPDISHADVQTWLVSGEFITVYALNEGADRDQVIRQLTRPEAVFLEWGQEIQIWERKSFLVVYPGSEGGVVLLISGLLGDAITREVSGPDEPYPPAVSAAQSALADELGIPPSEVQVLDYEDVLWPDGCLGIVVPNEACAQVETPGWRIELNAGGAIYVMHSDAIGQQIKRAE
jgi:hypothetical protein